MSETANQTPDTTEIRPAKDASDDKRLQRDPSHADAKLDVALDESFPTSDAPANTKPGQSSEPAVSSGYDEEEEERIAAERA
ncbi:hypothetical protein HL653_07175 [Sphingomonas sp. AP4-R1]|uniref:hypothetical protein n=1 Tax=Sphingomonas sp. AP4-R1 TaxID=2735134 RepID=UPI0014937EC3|nr:hypothetical protein [Sphingomonas sp. AP4-R1]QJU57599.1 hypothetical protein HL653_07175 [Sphingomonas sp. AP4-R1]